MAIVVHTPSILVTLEQSKLASVLVSFIFKNENPNSSVKAMYIVLCKGSEAENKRTDISVFEDKMKLAEISDRWSPLRNGLFLYPGQEITPDIWEYAVKELDYAKETPIIPCPIITVPDNTFLSFSRKLDRTKELNPECKANLLKLHALIGAMDPTESLLEQEDQIATKIKTAFT